MVKEFKIGNRVIGENHPPFVIAEVGINHEGSLEKALQCVDAAGANFCKSKGDAFKHMQKYENRHLAFKSQLSYTLSWNAHCERTKLPHYTC